MVKINNKRKNSKIRKYKRKKIKTKRTKKNGKRYRKKNGNRTKKSNIKRVNRKHNKLLKGGSMTGSFFKMLADSYDQNKYEKNRLNQEDYNEMMEKKIEREKKQVENYERLYQEEKRENEEEHRQENENDEFNILVDGNSFGDDTNEE